MAKVIVIGPYHPALIEPELYEVTVSDDRIVDVNIKQGYTHRGIEKLLTTKTYAQDVLLCERICGFCSHAHTTCYCQTVEKVFEVEPPERAKYIRTMLFELERLQSHYLWTALLFHTLGEKEHFIKIVNAREKIMDLIELICGNRVHYGINTIGGVRRDLNAEMIGRLERVLEDVTDLSEHIIHAVREFAPKLSGIGPLPREKALALGVVGPVLRASGVESDVRKDDPYAAYENMDFEIQVEDEGDVLSRTLVRARETFESIKIIRQLLGDFPAGNIKTEIGEPPKEKEEVGRVEAPRGELIYFIKSNGTNIPERVKIRTPSFMNERSLREMLRGERLSDLPLILESIDRCISCTNRLTLIDQRTGKRRRVELAELRRGN